MSPSVTTPEPTLGAAIRAARRNRRWSQLRLVSELRNVGRRYDIKLPKTESVIVLISRWENNRCEPSEMYGLLLGEALEIRL